MGDVVKFYGKDAAKDPDAVLEQAVGEFQNVILIGWNKEGYLESRSDTNLNLKDILFLVESFKLRLVLGDFTEG